MRIDRPVGGAQMTFPHPVDFNSYIAQVRNVELLPWTGEVVELVGLLVASRGPAVAIGDCCEVLTSSGRRIRTQVVGFRDGHVLRASAGFSSATASAAARRPPLQTWFQFIRAVTKKSLLS